jgi:hypothetical protein
MEERRGLYRALVGRPEGKRLSMLGRLTRRLEENIKMGFQEMGCGGGGMDWIELSE